MDATRTRRTRDQARQAWYASHRQRRFARFLGFLGLRGPDSERIPSPGLVIPTRRRADLSSRNRPGRRSSGSGFSRLPVAQTGSPGGRPRPEALSVSSTAVSSARRASPPDPLWAPGPERIAAAGPIASDPSCRVRPEPRSFR